MIVGLTGLKNTGKSAAAAYLREQHGFHEIALADEVYRQVAAAFNVTEAQLRSREWKAQPQEALKLVNCTDYEFMQLIVRMELPDVGYNISPLCTEHHTCPRTSTFIIQRWATEYMRGKYGDAYWAELAIGKLRALPKDIKVVVSDVREDHEVEVFEYFTLTRGPVKCGIAKLESPHAWKTGHSSDRGLSRQYIDRIITSVPGDLPGLYQQLEDFINKGMKWKPLNLSKS